MTAPTKAERERLRGLLSAATPGPWRAVIEGEQPKCYSRSLIGLSANKDPDGYVSVVTEGETARPVYDVKANAEAIAAAVNALPELLDALATAEARAAKLEGVVECAKASVEINQALGDKAAESMQRLATAEAERLTLARALLESAPAALDGDPDAYFERRDAANDLAARIVAEADAAKVAT